MTRRANVSTDATVGVVLGAAAGTAVIVGTYLTAQKAQALEACRIVGGGIGSGTNNLGARVQNGCDVVVDDNDAFALALSTMPVSSAEQQSDEQLAAAVMSLAFPGCTWPPAPTWRITFEAGNQGGWADFVSAVGNART